MTVSIIIPTLSTRKLQFLNFKSMGGSKWSSHNVNPALLDYEFCSFSPALLYCLHINEAARALGFLKRVQRSDMRQQRNEAGAVKRMHKYQRVSVDCMRKVKQPWGSVYLTHQHGVSPALSWSWLLACYLATPVEHGCHHWIWYNQWRLCSPSYLKWDFKK